MDAVWPMLHCCIIFGQHIGTDQPTFSKGLLLHGQWCPLQHGYLTLVGWNHNSNPNHKMTHLFRDWSICNWMWRIHLGRSSESTNHRTQEDKQWQNIGLIPLWPLMMANGWYHDCKTSPSWTLSTRDLLHNISREKQALVPQCFSGVPLKQYQPYNKKYSSSLSALLNSNLVNSTGISSWIPELLRLLSFPFFERRVPDSNWGCWRLTLWRKLHNLIYQSCRNIQRDHD